jgi:protein tyrosine phosphatase (PTP) superfamily phosphohydrolase (DUF442 family)
VFLQLFDYGYCHYLRALGFMKWETRLWNLIPFYISLILLSLCSCEKAEQAGAPEDPSPTSGEIISADRPETWARPVEGKPGLSNFYQVSDTLYRGVQPEKEGFAELKKMGIKTVVNLRTFNSDRDQCKEAGLDYVKISMQVWEGEDDEIVDFLKIVSDPNRQPVFVHCQHGADRTETGSQSKTGPKSKPSKK